MRIAKGYGIKKHRSDMYVTLNRLLTNTEE